MPKIWRNCPMLRILALTVVVLAFGTSDASARSHHHHAGRHRIHVAEAEPSFFSWFGGFEAATEATVDAASRYLPHPSGCPRRAFCGCGAAQEVGRAGDRSLWLARNWFKFSRAPAAPGMAAVRSHHVFVLREHLHGSVWLTADYNSGHHLSRLHPRSIAGYAIVNPGT